MNDNLDNRLLWSLTAEELDHVALGVLHNFGAELWKDGDAIMCDLESGRKITVMNGHALTVSGLWTTIEAMESQDA